VIFRFGVNDFREQLSKPDVFSNRLLKSAKSIVSQYLPLVIRAIGQPLIMVPLSAVTTSGMAKERESGAASALFNMMRNIGGSIGIAGLSTLLSIRERLHSERIGESVTVYSGTFQERLQPSAAYFMSQGSDLSSARMRAIGAIGGLVRREAFLLAYGDCFLAPGCVLLG
jgi:DHA2 family multidrug resistance protein